MNRTSNIRQISMQFESKYIKAKWWPFYLGPNMLTPGGHMVTELSQY